MRRVAYIAVHYPAVSHTFIAREVAGLRALGIDVRTFSVWRAPPRDLLTDADSAEAARTTTLLPPTQAWVIRAHLHALLGWPALYAKLVTRALGLAPAGARGLMLAMSWATEAVSLWHRCSRDDRTHIHAHLGGTAPTVALLTAWLGNALDPDGPRWTWSMTVHGPTEFYDVHRESLAKKVSEATFVVCISDFARSQLMALVDARHWKKLTVVHCGVDPIHFGQVDRAGRGQTLEILTVARLAKIKGQAVALQAVARLLGDGIEARLTIVGDGPTRADLERLASELGIEQHVRFEGAQGQDQIAEYYRAADVFLLTSFGEGVPVVLMEAMATGLPVVAPGIMGIGELVCHGRNGLLVRPGRDDLFADALESLALDEHERLRLGSEGRKMVLDQFDIDASTREVARLFEVLP